MKKALLFLLLIFVSSLVFSQTEKGNFMLSGSTGIMAASMNIKNVYDGETYEKYAQNLTSFLPSGGYFIKDNLAIGVGSNISINTVKHEDGDKVKSLENLTMPFAAYYFPVEGNVRPILQVGLGIMTSTYKDIPKNGSDEKYTSSGLAINFGGGAAIFINNNISINLGLSYTKANLTDGDDSKYKTNQGNFAGNVGISVYL